MARQAARSTSAPRAAAVRTVQRVLLCAATLGLLKHLSEQLGERSAYEPTAPSSTAAFVQPPRQSGPRRKTALKGAPETGAQVNREQMDPGEIVDAGSLTHLPSMGLKLIDAAAFVGYACLLRVLIERHQGHASPIEGLGGDIVA
uniref:Uncharacterized protein n=1 Tax=Alexandrium catenella TaxID=2925 RepID=A0A7S1QJ61_ALECA|mmetsp:Transcript_33252/g.90047  ORF Transcript_33252/g.90047 Transcript_33252/m.90047 type:complete len:145 (+) Transcript_33252:100-534(+)|eukprot:CAMPEP_0171256608 /NCGR_PEP_ID=MMETSP0790-20130122/53399_1 /TAXON_ID=2925 /ORGANISM="Alexandrium catenella, Strain OF101" /LENGTH=144 /DNA_ID=CAMNT_0011724655 /DNA_START=36 /DNA_END=470 /DNA_ORIENTATION=+